MVVTAGDSQRERRVFVLYKFYPPPPFHPTSNTISPALPCPSVLISKAAIKILLPLPPTHPGGLMELWGTGGIYLKSWTNRDRWVRNTSTPINIGHQHRAIVTDALIILKTKVHSAPDLDLSFVLCDQLLLSGSWKISHVLPGGRGFILLIFFTNILCDGQCVIFPGFTGLGVVTDVHKKSWLLSSCKSNKVDHFCHGFNLLQDQFNMRVCANIPKEFSKRGLVITRVTLRMCCWHFDKSNLSAIFKSRHFTQGRNETHLSSPLTSVPHPLPYTHPPPSSPPLACTQIPPARPRVHRDISPCDYMASWSAHVHRITRLGNPARKLSLTDLSLLIGFLFYNSW